MPDNGEVIHALPNQPVHLWQYNNGTGAYYNGMGCGAFSTAMALSCYDPRRYGTYDVVRLLFDRMIKVPIFSGTFERENARMVRKQGYRANAYDHGTLRDLTAAVDAGVPTVLLINPGKFGIGQHDVLLVGYGADAAGTVNMIFIDNTARQQATSDTPGAPGNDQIPVDILGSKWTGCFTPVFSSDEQQSKWLQLTGRPTPAIGLVEAVLG